MIKGPRAFLAREQRWTEAVGTAGDSRREWLSESKSSAESSGRQLCREAGTSEPRRRKSFEPSASTIDSDGIPGM